MILFSISSVFNSFENTRCKIPQIGICLTMAGNWQNLRDFCSFLGLEEAENMNVCSWETIFNIEPAVMKISNLPIGTELILEYDSKRKYFVDSNTGKEIM